MKVTLLKTRPVTYLVLVEVEVFLKKQRPRTPRLEKQGLRLKKRRGPLPRPRPNLVLPN